MSKKRKLVSSKQIFRDHFDLEEPVHHQEFAEENILPEVGLLGIVTAQGMNNPAVAPVAGPAALAAVEIEETQHHHQ